MSPKFKSATVFLFFGLLLTLLAAASSCAGPLEGALAHRDINHKVQQLLQHEDYQQLEDFAEQLRSTKRRFTDNKWQLTAFYSSFSATAPTEQVWLERISKIERWRDAYPHSVTATVALGRAWLGYGWYARGTGYTKTVSDEGWRLFRERLGNALQLVVEPPSGQDCPGRHLLLLNLTSTLPVDAKLYQSTFQRAIEFAPDYFELYRTAAFKLLPRWGGAPGVWLRFAEKAAATAPDGEQDLLYLMIVSGIQATGEIKKLPSTGVSWPKLRSGFQQLQQKFPRSPYNLNRLALFACLAEDTAMLRQTVNSADFIINTAAWVHIDMDRCLSMAKLPSQGELSLQQLNGSLHDISAQIYQDMLGKARAGDRQAMRLVGEMLAQGDGTARDDLQAYGWLTLAGDQELRDRVYQKFSIEDQSQALKAVEAMKKMLQ